MLPLLGHASRCGCIVETQERRVLREEYRMRGFPHSNDPEETMKGELWVGVTQSGWSPVTWIPVKRDPEGCEAKGRGLNNKQ
jgi:hypothetical protein